MRGEARDHRAGETRERGGQLVRWWRPIQLKRLHEKKGVLEIIRRSEARRIDLATVVEEKPAEPSPEKNVEEPAPAEVGR